VRTAWASGSFDTLGLSDVRLLQEASRHGSLRVALWTDVAVERLTGKPPRHPQQERSYVLESLRYVTDLVLDDQRSGDVLPAAERGDTWVMPESQATEARATWCRAQGISLRALRREEMEGLPRHDGLGGRGAEGGAGRGGAGGSGGAAGGAGARSVVVTGCYDWLHSGHVRFFEEVSAYGDLYVVVGSDANVRLLKGEGHPLFPQEVRLYMVGAVRFVADVLVSTGSGWMDAEPEIRRLRPDIYAVNDDGDKPEKREFCRQHGLEYLVLTRTPKPGLPARNSTVLRGF
jgi:cytidyltransferase-like protein